MSDCRNTFPHLNAAGGNFFIFCGEQRNTPDFMQIEADRVFFHLLIVINRCLRCGFFRVLAFSSQFYFKQSVFMGNESGSFVSSNANSEVLDPGY